MNNKFLFLTIILLLFTKVCTAQVQKQKTVQVGTINNSINASAALQIDGVDRGFLPPRMNTESRNAIVNPSPGLTIYNTDISCIEWFSGIAWSNGCGISITSGGSAVVLDYVCNTASTGILNSGIVASNVSQTITANVKSVGTYNIKVTNNGLTFSGSGTFAGTGLQNIVLVATGTPSTSGSIPFTLTTVPNCTFSRDVLDISTGGTAKVNSYKAILGCSIGATSELGGNVNGVTQAGLNKTLVKNGSIPSDTNFTIIANVTQTGTYNISTDLVNGVVFNASGVFSSIGDVNVVLTPSGTPINSGNFKWSINTTPSIKALGSVLTTNAPTGSTYVNHYNGIINGVSVDGTLPTYTSGEVFSNNLICASKPISAQSCNGVTSVTGASGKVYPTVNINGQCWLQYNLDEIPSEYSNFTPTSWIKPTTILKSNDGYWGYRNSVSDGSAGWGVSEIAVNYGLLYMWCAAMNGTISERSQGTCPSGFHVPSDCEFQFLEHGLGMELVNQPLKAPDRDNVISVGIKLVSTTSLSGFTYTNNSGFSGLYAGYNWPSEAPAFKFGSLTLQTSTGSVSNSTGFRENRRLFNNQRYSQHDSWPTTTSVSLRCLKD
jgi:uncharacterized protein (TIGR02145 family)